MKKLITPLLIAVSLVLSSCSIDQIDNEGTAKHRLIDVSSKTSSALTTDLLKTSTSENFCHSSNLIAGQNMIAGIVTVSYNGTNLTITYSTTSEWTIGVTHLSIGNCSDDPIPTNGGGNPMVGQFEYNNTHPDGTHEVTYIIDATGFEDKYCFAAHAEVSSATGEETAWAEGLDFPGNSWAMYVSSSLSDCPDTTGDDDSSDNDTGR